MRRPGPVGLPAAGAAGLLGLLAACVLCAAVGLAARPVRLDTAVLLVVGYVDYSSARLLVDCGPRASAQLACPYRLAMRLRSRSSLAINADSFTPWLPQPAVDVGPQPRILLLSQLSPCTSFELQLLTEDNHVAAEASFRSRCSTAPLRFAVLSCDRVADDPDDAFVAVLASELKSNAVDVVLHLGDQIYADKIFDRYHNASYQQVLPQLQEFYRYAWTRPHMRDVMRNGMHLMLPDDHDIFNALEPEVTSRPELQGYVIAAADAVRMYQLSLAQDQQIGDVNVTVHAPYFSFDIGSTGFVLLDTRFYRGLTKPEDYYSLTGKAQVLQLERTLQQWRSHNDIDDIVVLTSVPLLFPSQVMARVADLAEGDRYPNHPSHHSNTFAILELLWNAHASGRQVTLFSGDIHSYLDMDVCRSEEGQPTPPCMHSYSTSGLHWESCAANLLKLALFDSIMYWFTSISMAGPGSSVVYDGNIQELKLMNNFMLAEKARRGSLLQTRVVFRAEPWSQVFRRVVGFNCGAWILLSLLLALLYFTFRLCCCRGRRGLGRPKTPPLPSSYPEARGGSYIPLGSSTRRRNVAP